MINSVTHFAQTVKSDPKKKMIDVRRLAPAIAVDLKYAGDQNFMHRKLYTGKAVPLLRLPAATSLAAVQRELNKKGIGIKIWDAYRPYSVTEKMWELVKDERYAANPKFGSGHNRGVAVDLTLIDLKTKKELDMGTGFDNFSDTAHGDYVKLPVAVLANRQLLKTTMEKHGFKVLETEWWHFYLPDAKQYELLDLRFEELF